MPIPELIEKKLDEYGIEIVNQYDCDGEYYFCTADMIICYREKFKKLSVSFDASTIPERVGNNIMILQEVEGLNHDFEILDSYIYGREQKFVTGKKAHEAVKKAIETKFLSEFQRKEAMFQQLLSGAVVGTA